MITYLTQIQSRAKALGVDLKEACRAEGIAHTTLARWLKGDATPREQTAGALMARIELLAATGRRRRGHGRDA